ncbi:hypothetical protein, conserved [Plasmodium ovale wallikeri]|uniref:Uncharacterized protein n=2 Tax=Plasmodium ovale TaxID=36330 RepID=A0A1A8ZE11_PLAOA|nr:hypothetical protein, conserved [Plasmodium ovale wallikeri]SBT42511.1 hypothetical protein, conserved [Plasmodium ovale wallikeri]SBT78293.1 conserved Plasmodium protein, unknown function [Plasmodium ovale]
MDVHVGEDLDLSVNSDMVKDELDNFNCYKSDFNKYDVLYDEKDVELKQLSLYEERLKKLSSCINHFEHVQCKLKEINELDVNRREQIFQSNEMTNEIVDEINKLKKEKYDISKKEIIYDKMLEEYSLSPLCYNNLTDIKISINIDFFEYLKQFEYTKENIIKLLNENSSDKISKFYSKHYNKILNNACKKMCLYIIRENNDFYKKMNKIVNLLLCPIFEEQEKRKIIIKNCIQYFTPITKLCYTFITENIEYFNMCLSSLLHFRKKLLTKNYHDLVTINYKTIKKKKNLEIDIKDDSIQIFKNFFSIIYYLITLEDIFLKILLLFNYYYTSVTITYITAHVENMHNNLYNIIDVLFIPCKNFLETNINIHPKSYDACYELFHILDIFIFKLKQFQNNYELNNYIRETIEEYATEKIRIHDAPNENRSNENKISNEIINNDDFSFLRCRDFMPVKKKENESYPVGDINNVSGTLQRVLQSESDTPNAENESHAEKDQNEETPHTSNVDNRVDDKHGDDTYTSNGEPHGKAQNERIDQAECNETKHASSKNNSVNKIASHAYSNNRSSVDDAEGSSIMEVSQNNDELSNKIRGKSSAEQKYNCKILSYIQKLQKNIENEFIAIWQQDVVTFFLNKVTKVEDPNYYDSTLFCIKKIFNSLNNVYSIYKNSSHFRTYNNEMNFQNVLDITINPLINNSLKNKNRNVESDYIFIVNIFTFIQENIKKFEGYTKYYDLLTIIMDEKKEKIVELEKSNLMGYLKMDKIKEHEKNVNEIKLIIDNFYKFAFSDKLNIFHVINKIESIDIKNGMKCAIFNYMYDVYVSIYEAYANKVTMIYTPLQIKDVLLKSA